MRVARLEFEGDVEEYERVRGLFEGGSGVPLVASTARGTSAVPAEANGDPGADVDEHAFFDRVLTRIPVPNGQRLLFRAVPQEGQEMLSISALAERIERTVRQLAGVLGALGHRVSATPGPKEFQRPGIGLFLEVERTGGALSYRLRPEAKRALERHGLL